MDELEAYLRAHPRASRRDVMKALGVSARAVRRAEDAVSCAHAARRRRLRWAALFAVAVLAAAAVCFAIARRADPGRAAERSGPSGRQVQAVESERSLYRALDQGDPGLAAEALANLDSGDEALRLAALRYLAKTAPVAQAEALLRLVDDPAERVRRTALQTLGASVPGPLVDARLAQVALDRARPQAERLLALSALEGRRVAEPRAVARQLVELLDDPAPYFARRAPALLAKLAGGRPAAAGADPAAQKAAWLGLLQGVS